MQYLSKKFEFEHETHHNFPLYCNQTFCPFTLSSYSQPANMQLLVSSVSVAGLVGLCYLFLKVVIRVILVYYILFLSKCSLLRYTFKWILVLRERTRCCAGCREGGRWKRDEREKEINTWEPGCGLGWILGEKKDCFIFILSSLGFHSVPASRRLLDPRILLADCLLFSITLSLSFSMCYYDTV